MYYLGNHSFRCTYEICCKAATFIRNGVGARSSGEKLCLQLIILICFIPKLIDLFFELQVIDIKCPEALEEPPDDKLQSDAIRTPKQHNYGWDEIDGGRQI